MINFERIHTGYWMGESNVTGESYVVRTRPKNDGWMAISEDIGSVLSTGHPNRFEAMKACEGYDRMVAEGKVIR